MSEVGRPVEKRAAEAAVGEVVGRAGARTNASQGGVGAALGELTHQVERAASGVAALAKWIGRTALLLIVVSAIGGIVTWLVWFAALHDRKSWGLLLGLVLALVCAVPALLAWSLRRRTTASRMASLRLHHDLKDLASSHTVADLEEFLKVAPTSLKSGLGGQLAALKSFRQAAAGLKDEKAAVSSAVALTRTLALVPARVGAALGALGLLGAFAVVGVLVAVLT